MIIIATTMPIALTGCRKHSDATKTQADTNKPTIAVTSTYLVAALQEMYATPGKIICLAPPGTCPGHFDISPATIKKLARCNILFRFTFQHGQDGKLSYFTKRGLRIYSIPVGEGMCRPNTYLNVCQSIYEVMQKSYPRNKTAYQQKLAHTRLRLHNLALQLHNRINKFHLTNQPVLTSIHQAAFARWLGLNVVGTFTSSDLATISSIENSLKQARTNKVKYIIANTPTSINIGHTLAEKTKAKLVIFSNFPTPTPITTTPITTHGNNQINYSFDTLLQNNVDAIIKACSHNRNKE